MLVKFTNLFETIFYLQKRYPGVINSARGRGTMLAVDCHTVDLRSKLIKTMMNKGLLYVNALLYCLFSHCVGFVIQPCGQNSIRFRPALIFQPKHAVMFLGEFEDALKRVA